MGADILERLNDSLVWASPRERALRTDAAAEIVRLRGEAERLPAWIIGWMADREILPDDDGDGISEGALVEALNNHERELLNAIPKAPAAVPAGEAVAVCGTCNGVGMIGGHRGQTPDSFEQWAEDCPDCTPQPADGETLAPFGWAVVGPGGSMFIPNTHPNVADHLRALASSSVRVTEVYTTPPAPVQAAPQEGGNPLAEVHEYMNQRVAHDVAAFRRAANPSACELGAVRVTDRMISRYEDAAIKATKELTDDPATFGHKHAVIRAGLEAALQHRGDSRGGEG